MQLPNKEPLFENLVATSADELEDLIQRALSKGSGVFLKVFTKDRSGKYYITVLLDRSKALAAECLLVDKDQILTGEEAVNLLRSLLGSPMVIDVYALDELEIKISIADNVEAYVQTPKIPLSELFGKSGGSTKVGEKSLSETVASKVERTAVEKPALAGGTVQKPEKETMKPAPPKEPEIIVNFTGGELPRRAFQAYAEELLKESRKIRGLSISRIEFEANAGEGVVYLNVRIYGTSTGDSGDIQIAERRMLHAVSKYAPIILREADVKPILRDVSVVIDGQEVKPQEIVEREKKKQGNVTKDGSVTLSVLEDVWPYFSAYAKTVITELRGAGLKIKRAHFDVRGRREFEINLSVVVESGKEDVEKLIRDTLTRHARELGRSINRYITVHNVDVEVITPTARGVARSPVVSSGKAAEVLIKKEDLEKEVEKLLKQAGIDELSPLTEEKKKETQETFLKSRIEPAIERLKTRINAEMKLIPRVTFKWFKMNHEVKGSEVIVDVEASFMREETGGLFGSFSGVSDDRLKKDIKETVMRIIREVSREYGVKIKLRKLNVILR
ncbi:hypothetical protein A3L12_05450 [Thermococcus sp. P6]|nr:hypothetical protein [Thermococcus sp. P6]ASJ10781.1 hypothetical protein A3L12_05450 [Thermococcus sp. P6]